MADQQTPIPPTTQIIAAPQAEDEISLHELWEILAKRKWVVFLTTVVCLGLAILYVSLATTIYESRAVVQIGKIAGQPLDNGTQLGSRLLNQYTPVNTEQAQKQLPKLYSVTPDKDDGSILTLEDKGRSPQEAQQYLQTIIQRLLTEDEQRYQQIIGMRQAQLKELQGQYQQLRKSLKVSTGKGQSNSASALLLLEQSHRADALVNIQASISNMENQLAPNNTSQMVVTLSPRYDPIPVAPKRGVILVLAVLGGLIFGAVLALLLNAVRKEPASPELHHP